jgi:uncharacterized lipoprotein YehR (DUF1307 family)
MKNYLGCLAIFTLIACNNSAKTAEEKKDTAGTTSVTLADKTPVFKDDKVTKIYTGYLQLKDALVGSKAGDAQTAAKVLAGELKNVNGCENTSLIAQKIADAKDIVTQRKEFTALSTDVIALFKHADLVSGMLYVQHCPMANEGNGGDWLSSEKKIQNPYYGSEMMECGAVISEIKAK